MADQVTFLDCPAHLDTRGVSRCGLPAEVEDRYTMSSTSGPLESVQIRCPRGHWFNGPAECLAVNGPAPDLHLSRIPRPRPGRDLDAA